MKVEDQAENGWRDAIGNTDSQVRVGHVFARLFQWHQVASQCGIDAENNTVGGGIERGEEQKNSEGSGKREEQANDAGDQYGTDNDIPAPQLIREQPGSDGEDHTQHQTEQAGNLYRPVHGVGLCNMQDAFYIVDAEKLEARHAHIDQEAAKDKPEKAA